MRAVLEELVRVVTALGVPFPSLTKTGLVLHLGVRAAEPLGSNVKFVETRVRVTEVFRDLVSVVVFQVCLW